MSNWIDLGNGEAIKPSRIGKLLVVPPTAHKFFRPYREQLSWTVHVLDQPRSVWHTVAYYWAEERARAHARRIVGQMLEEGNKE